MNNIFEILKKVTNFETIHSNITGAEITEDIIITDRAIQVLKQEFSQHFNFDSDDNSSSSNNYFIRLHLISTPSKAKQFLIKFDNIINEFDRIYYIGKMQFVVDRKSIFYYMGIIIDYIKDDDEEGFVFLDSDDFKVTDYYLQFIVE